MNIMKYLKTSQIAKAAGVHPNTVRLYEQWGLLMPVDREDIARVEGSHTGKCLYRLMG
jgi:hypothetical protein